MPIPYTKHTKELVCSNHVPVCGIVLQRVQFQIHWERVQQVDIVQRAAKVHPSLQENRTNAMCCEIKFEETIQETRKTLLVQGPLN